jgi:hypothetical protein
MPNSGGGTEPELPGLTTKLSGAGRQRKLKNDV